MTLKPIILAAVIASLPGSLMADTSFSDAYTAYQSAVESNDAAEQLKQAALAFKLGKAKFGESHINSANLAMNYAKAIGLKGDYSARSNPESALPRQSDLLKYALSIYELEYGEDAIELVDPLVALGRSYEYGIDSKSDIKTAAIRAINLSKNEAPLFRARIYNEAWYMLKSVPRYRSLAKGYLFDAHALYLEHAPENTLERNLVAFHVAKYYIAERRYSKAETILLEVIRQFQALDYSDTVELAAHAFLVDIYERQGERESATEHCLAIGSMKPWNDSQEPEPLFRIAPEYPVSAAKRRKEGWVQMKFTIDKMGFVREPEVIKSDGGAAFEKSALKTIQKWRYAPKFEDGEVIDAKDLTVQIDYRIN